MKILYILVFPVALLLSVLIVTVGSICIAYMLIEMLFKSIWYAVDKEQYDTGSRLFVDSRGEMKYVKSDYEERLMGDA